MTEYQKNLNQTIYKLHHYYWWNQLVDSKPSLLEQFTKTINLAPTPDKEQLQEYQNLIVESSELKTIWMVYQNVENLLELNLESAPPLTAKTVMGSAPDKIEISSEMEM